MRRRIAAACAASVAPFLAVPAAIAAEDLPCLEEHAEALPVPSAKTETIGGRPTIRFLPPQPKGLATRQVAFFDKTLADAGKR